MLRQPRTRLVELAAVLALSLAACQTPVPLTPFPATPTGPAAPTASLTLTASAQPTPVPDGIYLPTDLPASFLAQVQLPAGFQRTDQPEQAGLSLAIPAAEPWSSWIYALVAPFPTLADETNSAALRQLWQAGQVVPEGPETLLVDPATVSFFTALWGAPSAAVVRLPTDQLLTSAWAHPGQWALVPFDQLEPRWKVIAVDGQNPLHKDFAPQAYTLRVDIGLQGAPDLLARLDAAAGPQSVTPLLPSSNRRADRLTVVALTGVTALVRGTAAYMEEFGMDYPAEDILPWLQDADILHISNEVAFAKDCPSPNNWQGLAFCSQERYLQLLDDIGTDVVDLAGDHFADWGQEAMHFTLELYRQRGWPVYGGGETLAQARQPALFEHNGNRIAFLGCNYKNPAYATASDASPGAIHCDPAWLDPAIQAVIDQAYLPIVTLQDEEYYQYAAQPIQLEHFQTASQAGALIVSGDQAHQPQGMTFDGPAFIHYGLGNLFFDQAYTMASTRNAFIDHHVFYEGRYISTELLTITFVDYARSRPATAQERRELLKTVFAASQWPDDSRLK